MKAKQKALVEQIEKEKVQSNKGSAYKLLVEQAKLKQATSKVSRCVTAHTMSVRPCSELGKFIYTAPSKHNVVEGALQRPEQRLEQQ